MKNLFLFIFFGLSICMFGNDFTIQRGVNVSHWLSQTDMRGEERANYVTEADFIKISQLGFDHVRLPVDEEQLWTESGEKEPAAFDLMVKGVKWSIKHNLRIIVDLHTLRSHHFNIASSRTLWTSPEAQNQLIGFWKDLSAVLNGFSTDSVAYEIMNEAVADDSEDWNKLLARAIAEIRKTEPERTIVVGSNMWQIPSKFTELKVPENDKNIIVSFHTYTPLPFTHYKAPWASIGFYKGPVHYPGLIVKPEDLKDYTEEQKEEMAKLNGVFNKDSLAKDILIAVKKAKEWNLPLFCGEFGCFPTTPIEMRQKWYADMMAIFNENNISWCHWNYKNDFPLVDPVTGEPIRELLDVLIPEEKE